VFVDEEEVENALLSIERVVFLVISYKKEKKNQVFS